MDISTLNLNNFIPNGLDSVKKFTTADILNDTIFQEIHNFLAKYDPANKNSDPVELMKSFKNMFAEDSVKTGLYLLHIVILEPNFSVKIQAASILRNEIEKNRGFFDVKNVESSEYWMGGWQFEALAVFFSDDRNSEFQIPQSINLTLHPSHPVVPVM